MALSHSGSVRSSGFTATPCPCLTRCSAPPGTGVMAAESRSTSHTRRSRAPINRSRRQGPISFGERGLWGTGPDEQSSASTNIVLAGAAAGHPLAECSTGLAILCTSPGFRNGSQCTKATALWGGCEGK
eukprot:scaffold14628_cov118-Isochrysis_galbana.AAC.7